MICFPLFAFCVLFFPPCADLCEPLGAADLPRGSAASAPSAIPLDAEVTGGRSDGCDTVKISEDMWRWLCVRASLLATRALFPQ